MAEFFLARAAERFFWLARYVERAENLARVLDVNATFARDQRGALDWLAVLRLYTDAERFAQSHGEPTAEAVLRFYVTDRENPTSIASAVAAARENARLLRPLISPELWAQLNGLHRWAGAIDDAELAPGNLPRLLGRVREACQTHAGIAEGTLHRDQGSSFYRIGRCIERADQTTRLIDIKYHALLPKPDAVGSPVDIGQWSVVLLSAAAHNAYLRVVAGGVSPAGVAGFLLLHPRFPRAVAFCVGEACRLVGLLGSRDELPGAEAVRAELASLSSLLAGTTIEQVIIGGLHEFLDGVQRQLIAATDDLTAAFFGRRPVAVATQQQSQA